MRLNMRSGSDDIGGIVIKSIASEQAVDIESLLP